MLVINDPYAPLSNDINDYCFIDSETRSTHDVTIHGADNHIRNGMVTMVPFAVGDAAPELWQTRQWDRRLKWATCPSPLHDFYYDKVLKGRGWFVAWNAFFDRKALGLGVDGGPKEGHVENWLDCMVPASKNHLPIKLEDAARAMKVKTQKRASGKQLIAMFADANREETPESHPEEWEEFGRYAVDDVGALRDIWVALAALPCREWQEYWAAERINNRGLPIDREFAQRAGELATYAHNLANSQIAQISGHTIQTVNQNEKILGFVRDRLRHQPEADRILLREIVEEADGDNDVVRLEKFSLERNRVEELLLFLARLDEETGMTDEEYAAYQLLEVRLYGASATPRKFNKALPLLTPDGMLPGQYVFHGAGATGRFSSRALQVHNLTRSIVEALKE